MAIYKKIKNKALERIIENSKESNKSRPITLKNEWKNPGKINQSENVSVHLYGKKIGGLAKLKILLFNDW